MKWAFPVIARNDPGECISFWKNATVENSAVSVGTLLQIVQKEEVKGSHSQMYSSAWREKDLWGRVLTLKAWS